MRGEHIDWLEEPLAKYIVPWSVRLFSFLQIFVNRKKDV